MVIEVNSLLLSKLVRYDLFHVKYVIKQTNLSYSYGLGKHDMCLTTHVGRNLHCQYQMITAQMQSKD